MATSTASVATDRPERYAKQLVAHLGRRVEAAWDEPEGRVDLGSSRARLLARPGALELTIEGTDLARAEDVIGRHLVRFGRRGELTVDWVRDDGTPGTSYRNDDADDRGDHGDPSSPPPGA